VKNVGLLNVLGRHGSFN